MKNLSVLLESEEFINDNISDGFVILNEKIDASRITVAASHGTFKIIKRNGKLVETSDLILNHFYESAYTHIEDEFKKGHIKDGMRIGFDYIPDVSLNSISYSRKPKNDLILTDLKINEFQIYDKDRIWNMADLLDVERSPIIYHGPVSECNLLKELIGIESRPLNESQKEYDKISLMERIISHSEYTKPLLQSSPTDMIEGIAGRIKTSDNQFVFQVNNNVTESKRISETPSDVYTLVINDMINFFEGRMIYEEFKSIEPQNRYVEIINNGFVEFINEYKEKYRNTKSLRPSYMNSHIWDINKKYINDQSVISVINENESFGEVYKIMMASFRKKKSVSYGFLTESDITRFNKIVEKMILVSDGLVPSQSTYNDLF